MKKKLSSLLIITLVLLAFNHKVYAQKKDTLHIYYAGLQTQILDSNDVKIAKWAKSLNGKHHDVELYTYYDNSDFKKHMIDRLENLNMIVLRKARDITSVKNMQTLKGKKSQRIVADIVFFSSDIPTSPVVNTEEKKPESKKTETNQKKNVPEDKAEVKTEKSKEKKQEQIKEEKPIDMSDNNGEYVIDSLYVNGVLKVTKRKVKK